MVYKNLHDLARKKAALNAELKMHEKQIKALKTSLLAPAPQTKGKGAKGFLGIINSKNVVSTTISFLDGAWFAWKLYKKFKRK